jgi:predicted metallopeptidase
MTAECDELGTAFRTVGTTFGYEDIDVKFGRYKEFKSTWCRSGKKVSFQITDYLSGAGPEVLEDFALSLYMKIAHRGEGNIYGPRLKEYLVSDDFLERNQPLYVKRSRNLSRSPLGENFDLRDTHNNLLASGMLGESRNVSLNWTINENRMRVGYCSTIMHVVAISSLLDNMNVPEYVHEYVLYHELLHLEDGLSNGRRHHTAEFRAKEHLYPRWRESEDWLRRLAAKKVDLSRS